MDKNNMTVLLVDDDYDDLYLLTEVMNMVDASYSVLQANNGEEAMQMLCSMKGANHQLPCLIVLDINMPKMDGKQTLAAIQKDPELNAIPVVIFSTSKSEMDKMYFKYRNVEMITKPVEFTILHHIARKMLSYCKD
jgi:CheY-like chemotaxis protein